MPVATTAIRRSEIARTLSTGNQWVSYPEHLLMAAFEILTHEPSKTGTMKKTRTEHQGKLRVRQPPLPRTAQRLPLTVVRVPQGRTA